jgi:hypothetical protein
MISYQIHFEAEVIKQNFAPLCLCGKKIFLSYKQWPKNSPK